MAAQEEQKIKKILKTSLEVAKELFIFSLIFYLLLFVLETVFPGFVSNNFNLNWVLALVLVLGIVSAFAPEKPKEAEEKEKPKITDYLTSIFLGVLGGFLIFYKIQLDIMFRLIISLISGGLIIALSLILLTVEDEEVKEREEEIETFVKETFISRKTFITPIAFFRLLLFKKVNFPVLLILIVFLFTALALPQKSGTSPRKLSFGGLTSVFQPAPTPEEEAEPSPLPILGEVKEKPVPSTEIMIKVLNGGTEKNAASDFAKILKEASFAKIFFGDADNLKYKNATIKFRPEDKDQASLIKDLLKEEYITINEAPSGTTSAEITVILGTRVTEEGEEEITILTPE